ncbi:MAG TPA: hypothetical protein VFH68_27225 [Polyangia bacterium]|jgi:hypothetical protein|nr:hypothetical protein [Polyangia bacterium]
MTARPQRFGSLVILTTSLGLFTVGSGCDRAHLTASYGRAYNQSFAVQTVNPDRHVAATAVHGLDSQEAAIISASYRRSLSPKQEQTADHSQLLMYSPRSGLREPNMPPPSVPNER